MIKSRNLSDLNRATSSSSTVYIVRSQIMQLVDLVPSSGHILPDGIYREEKPETLAKSFYPLRITSC